MSLTLRVVLIFAILCYFIIVFYLLKKQILSLKYTLLWLLTGVVLGILVAAPELLSMFVGALGIELPVNGLFTVAIGFILMILMSLTAIVSGFNKKIRVLVQQIAILEKRIRELERENGT